MFDLLACEPDEPERPLTLTSMKLTLSAGAIVALVAFTGCSSDSSSTTSTCSDLQQLSTDVRGLSNVDVVSTGLDGLEQQTNSITDAFDAAKKSGDEQFGSQLDALDSAISALGTTLSDATSGGQSIRDVVNAVGDDIQQITTAYDDLQTAVSSELSDCDLSASS